jgi:hypothetical protein
MDNVADLRERLDCPVFYSPHIVAGNAQLPEALIASLIASMPGKGSAARVAG